MKNPHICKKSQRFLKFKNLPGLCKGLAKVLQLLFYISINDKKGLLINGDDPLTCRPIKQGESRVLHFQTMNLALQTEWVDMMLEVLKDNYGPWMDLERSAAPVRGAWALRHILKQVLPQIQDFFLPELGDISSFRVWLDEWSTRATLQ